MSAFPMIEMLTATSSVLLMWGLAASVFIGLGLAIQRLLGLKAVDLERCLTAFWMGFCVVIIFLQLWHFWFPVNGPVLVLVIACGTLGLVLYAPGLWKWRQAFRPGKDAPALILCGVVALWMANLAIGPEKIYEAALYQLGVVRWTTTFPLVPGLGNLHGRLAFNNSSLLYAALFEAGPWHGRSNHVANGLLIVVLFIQIVLSGLRLFRVDQESRAAYVLDVVLLAPILVGMVFRQRIASLSTDLTVAVLLFLAASRCFAFLTSKEPDQKTRGYDLVVMATTLSVAFCVKASAAAFVITAWCLLFIVWFIRAPMDKGGHKNRRRTVCLVFMFSLMTIGPWLARGVILSGYPLYPLSIVSVPVEWRLPVEGESIRRRPGKCPNCGSTRAIAWNFTLRRDPGSSWRFSPRRFLVPLFV